jgi:hypothetical protein
MALDITEIKIRDKVTIAGTEITSVETTLTGGNSALPRADAVKAYVDSLLNANDAMQFKGTIGTGGTVTALPTTHSAGWTYRVITAATYAGVVTEVGDLIIAVIDRAGTGNANSDWTVVQTNIDGAVIGPSSSTSGNISTFNGTTGKLIQDSGISFETTLTTSSDTKSPTSKAVATYVTGLGYTTNTGTVTAVTGTAPIASSGGTAPVISITAATTSAAGSMSSADKTKLDGIAAGAQVNVATNLAQGTRTTTQVPVTSSTGTTATLDSATTSLAGVMSSADKTKLDGIAAGAQVNVGTNLTWTAGTTAGPTVNSSTGTGQAIPSASISASGAVTTGAQEFAGNKTFRAATTQDGIVLAGRAGGTGSFGVTLTPTTLTASRTLTLPDAAGTVALTSQIPAAANNATLSLTATAGATNTSVTIGTGTGFSANDSTNRTYDIDVGPALTNLATTMTGAGTGILRKTAADTYEVVANTTYLTAHPTITVAADTTSTASPAFGGTFTAIDGVTRDGNGHVTTLNTKTVTIPTPSYPTVNNGTLTLAVSGTGLSGSASFTANQSTASTFTVTSNATSANTASAIVARDASGNFSAGTITASLSGNASTVTNGVYTTGTQSIGGLKTFTDDVTITESKTDLDFNALTINATSNFSFGVGNTATGLRINSSSSDATFGTATGIYVSAISNSNSGAVGIYSYAETGLYTAQNSAGTDGVRISGRAGGTSYRTVNLTPTTLTASRTLTLPDADGTVALTSQIPTVNNGTLTLATSGIATGSASFTANQSGNSTFTVNVPATNLGITAGTTSGPVVTSSTGTNATLPLASTTASGVLSNAAQTIGGEKTFANGIVTGSGTQTWQIESGTNLLFRSGSTPTTRMTISDAGTVTATTFVGALTGNASTATASSSITVNATSTAGNFKMPFVNTTGNTTGNYELLHENEATFTYNPSTNTLVAGTFSGSGASLTSLPAGQLTGTVASARLTEGLLGELETSFNIGRIWSRPFNSHTWTLRRDVTTPTAVTSNTSTYTTFALGYTPTTGASGDILKIELSLGSTTAQQEKIFVEVTCATNQTTGGMALLSADGYLGVSSNILQVNRYFAQYNISTSNLQVRYPTRARLA